jgi:hypothetical protein
MLQALSDSWFSGQVALLALREPLAGGCLSKRRKRIGLMGRVVGQTKSGLTIRSRRLATLAIFDDILLAKLVYNESNRTHPQAP